MAVFAASSAWQLVLVASGRLIGSRLGRPTARRVTGIASGLTIGGLAVWTLA